jgi:hypothetical protein
VAARRFKKNQADRGDRLGLQTDPQDWQKVAIPAEACWFKTKQAGLEDRPDW